MKKRLAACCAVLLLIFVFAVPALASETPASSGEPAQERLCPLLVDDAQLLDDGERAELLAKLEEISARQKMDIAIVTTAHTDGRGIEAYTDDFYDSLGYGQGPTKDGVMFLIAMDEREAYMTAAGRGISAFTDAGRAYILDNHVMPQIRAGAYAEAFCEFADQCDAFLTQAKTGKPYDGGFLPKGALEPLGAKWLLAAIVAGGLITAGVSGKLKKQMKTVAPQREANSYAVGGSLVITGKSDQFITTSTTRTPRAKQSGGGSGSTGSTTHTSSSGKAHSGTSRKF